MFTATTTGNYIRVIDAKTGVTKKMIRFSGKLIQGPVVSGEEMSVTVRVSPSLTFALIYGLPSGVLRRKLRV